MLPTQGFKSVEKLHQFRYKLAYIWISVSMVYFSTSETNGHEAVKCYKYIIITMLYLKAQL